jgi:hypothetical protein
VNLYGLCVGLAVANAAIGVLNLMQGAVVIGSLNAFAAGLLTGGPMASGAMRVD